MRYQTGKFYGYFVACILTFNGYAAISDSICSNPTLLDLTDRGSVANTPCVLKSKVVMLEAGYQYQTLTLIGSQQNAPQATFFLGLPEKTEVMVALPNYNHQSLRPSSGFGATTLGIKHEIKHWSGWVASAEILITPPSGSATFGSQGLGATVAGIVNYKCNSKADITLTLGGSTATEARIDGGDRFNSFNPGMVFSYSPTAKMSIFGEVFAQSKTRPAQGGNYNVDGGVLYLLTTSVVIDVEVGQQLSNEYGVFKNYIGSGITITF